MGMKSRLFASAAFPLLSLTLAIGPAEARAISAAGAYEVAQDAPAPAEEELLKKKGPPEGGAGEEGGRPGRAAEGGEGGGERPARGGERRQREAAPEAEQPEAAPRREPRAQDGAERPEAAPRGEAPAGADGDAPRRKRPAAEAPAEGGPAAAPEEGRPKEGEAPSRRDRRAQPPAAEAPAPQTETEGQPLAEPQAKSAPEAGQEQPKPRRKGEPRPGEENGQPEGGRRPTADGGRKPAPTEGEAPAKQPEAAPQVKPAQAPKAIAPAAPAPTEAPAPGAAPVAPGAAPAAPGAAPAAPGAAPAAPGAAPAEGTAPPAAPGAPAPAPAPGVAPANEAGERQLPPPEKLSPAELQRRREIAADPSKSTGPVVLPVENGAPILDSQKQIAPAAAGQPQGGDGQRQRRPERMLPPPTSDADAQRAPEGERRAPVRFEAVTREEGRRLSDRPQFSAPRDVRIDQRTEDNRVILQFNDQTIVRSDDDRRFLRDGERPVYEQLSRDRYRETIERPNGYRIVTIRNRYGDIIQRSRVDERGREYVLFYAPELNEDPDHYYMEDPGRDLPPMRLTIPVEDYIIDTSSDEDRDYYDFLREPPVEPVERVYSLNEVKYSARIRDKVRRIDLDTITFATGSAEIPMSQARSLRKVADAINEVIKKNPSETFLIEGHTDAVGSDQSNLILSDQRAESVANVLTDVYGIPPENLATQGYGERFLKVNTAGPNQENRRVTIRRVTALVKPVEAKK